MINYGTLQLYCEHTDGTIENFKHIENFAEAAADPTQVWIIHHRKETDEGLTRQMLITSNLYYNRPPEELIFLTRADHNKLHFSYKIMHSEEVRKRRAAALKGRKLSEEHKQKISEGVKAAMTDEVCAKISASLKGNTYVKGKHWKCRPRTKPAWNKGKKMSEEQKAKLRKPKSEEQKQKMRENRLGCRWYNNGTENRLFKQSEVPEGWSRGRIMKASN